MNLRALILLNPALFMPQTWYDNEPFMDIHARPVKRDFSVREPSEMLPLVHAVSLAQIFVKHPDDFRFRRYLWTSDTDRHGQRIYLGVNNGRMEIHRHLHISARWGVPAWS